MSVFQHIRLLLAREPGHPQGDAGDGWDLVAPLDDEGRLDADACRAAPGKCYVRRFIQDATVATGRLRHTVGNQWLMDLEGRDDLDAAGFRLGEELFTPGEYVSTVSAGGQNHTYLVARVVPVDETTRHTIGP